MSCTCHFWPFPPDGVVPSVSKTFSGRRGGRSGESAGVVLVGWFGTPTHSHPQTQTHTQHPTPNTQRPTPNAQHPTPKPDLLIVPQPAAHLLSPHANILIAMLALATHLCRVMVQTKEVIRAHELRLEPIGWWSSSGVVSRDVVGGGVGLSPSSRFEPIVMPESSTEYLRLDFILAIELDASRCTNARRSSSS